MALKAISPRRVLFFLISVICASSIFLTGFSIFLTKIFYDTYNPTAYSGWLGISIGGICLFLMCVVGLRGTHLVNLDLLLTYFWGITVFISALTLAVVSCFNSYIYVKIWLKHSWQKTSFNVMREYFCEPEDTAFGKCIAPINVGSVTQWCMENFNNDTDCQDIRDKAVSAAETFAESVTLSLGLVVIINLLLIFLSIYMCFKILTAPVITQSMNDVINYLLVLPMCGCIGLSVYLGQYSVLPYYSGLSRLNIGLATAQFVALPLGIAAGRMKSQIMITLYLILISMILIGLIAAGSVGLIYSGLIIKTFSPTVSQTAEIACSRNLGCCCCSEIVDILLMIIASLSTNIIISTGSGGRCPEWPQSEVINLLALDLKIAGFVAIVSVIYLLGALTVGLFVKNNLKDYKSDYI